METVQITRLPNKLRKIEKAVIRAEKLFLSAKERLNYPWDEFNCFSTDGPRRTRYGATIPLQLFKFIKQQNLPQRYECGVLGFGLGMSSFTLAAHFKHVAGYEIDLRLYYMSEKIRRQFSVDNVSFYSGDFLEADLSPFKIIYYYQPFFDDFASKMGEKLAEAEKGTLIIHNSFSAYSREVFKEDKYSQVYPQNGNSADFPFYVYRKISF